ncbi:MAG TPA: TRAM domain-containing protein [Vicinamibacterales bacterium]|nr:TRAM domain-containing protein [Vicinamibacterales bacterium]
MQPGTLLTLDIEKPAAGGRMLARHHGQVVLVSGAIPGERVSARVERAGKGVIYADTAQVLSASPDRRGDVGDWRCGGNVLAFIDYPRQLQLKGQIIQDALARIGRVPLASPPEVIGSPEHGYRMRARLHAANGRVGFFREGTHVLCGAAPTRQLADATNAWLVRVEELLARDSLSGLAAVELSENIGGERACHLELHAGVDASGYTALAEGLTGLSAARADRAGVEVLAGTPSVVDSLAIPGTPEGAPYAGHPVQSSVGHPVPSSAGHPVQSSVGHPFKGAVVRLQRDVRAFFQGNRFLLESLVHHVRSLVGPGPVVDLYAGVGLFGLSLAAAGAPGVIVVEGDPVSGADLRQNAEPFGERVRVERRSVEQFLALIRDRSEDLTGSTIIVDPPRTGMTREALAGTIARKPGRIVYVSCDVATFARDSRTLIDAGYELGELTGVDLFPNTAHVESIAVFGR